MPNQLKRMYDPVDKEDGHRVLIDGMWLRGVAKKDARVDDWCRGIAPSKDLLGWFDHDRWKGFYDACRRELREGNSPWPRTLSVRCLVRRFTGSGSG